MLAKFLYILLGLAVHDFKFAIEAVNLLSFQVRGFSLCIILKAGSNGNITERYNLNYVLSQLENIEKLDQPVNGRKHSTNFTSQ
jgi:hypothetical protein